MKLTQLIHIFSVEILFSRPGFNNVEVSLYNQFHITLNDNHTNYLFLHITTLFTIIMHVCMFTNAKNLSFPNPAPRFLSEI